MHSHPYVYDVKSNYVTCRTLPHNFTYELKHHDVANDASKSHTQNHLIFHVSFLWSARKKDDDNEKMAIID